MAVTQTDSNGLLKFMNTAASNIQVAFGRPSKSKKVNHRKYLEKRLQPKGPKTTKKSKVAPGPLPCSRQPIAGLTSSFPSNATHLYTESSTNEYDQLYRLVSQPSVFPPCSTAAVAAVPNTFAYSRPPSVHDETRDPEIDSLLSELTDSPQCSLYGDSSSAGSSRGSLTSNVCSSANLSLENTLVTPSDYYVLSPSDLSDFDESNYSSPRNLSPVNAYYPNVSPSPPSTYFHHNLTASYDCIPTGSSSAVTLDRPHGLSLPYNPSITELIAELVSTP